MIKFRLTVLCKCTILQEVFSSFSLNPTFSILHGLLVVNAISLILCLFVCLFFFHFSPLARSKKTAEIIWGSRQQQIIPEYDLREIDLYSFQVSFCLISFALAS